MDQLNPKMEVSTPGQDGGVGSKRAPPQIETPLKLDTPSRFLSRDQLFRPSFNIKVRIEKTRTNVDRLP